MTIAKLVGSSKRHDACNHGHDIPSMIMIMEQQAVLMMTHS